LIIGLIVSRSPSSGSSQTPISFQANVSRQKTKKWIDAPPADYGGDDWGDAYNDYQPSPPVAKASGLRQPGQVAKQASAVDKNKKAYGELPPLPPDASPVSPARNRPNSFLPNDEQRAFSNVHSGPPAPAVSTATRQASQFATNSTVQPPASQINPSYNLRVTTQPLAPTGLRKAGAQPGLPAGAQDSQLPSQVASVEESQPSASSKPSASSTDSIDFRVRKDFSPTAVPPPLQTRSSTAPPGNMVDPPSTRFPPRKSSIGQRAPFDMNDNARPSQEAIASRPRAEARSSSPGASARSPTSPVKTLPIIRPADIYRRLEEEREKGRQSIDSSRPSMDSVGGGKTIDRSSSPAAKPTLIAQSSSDSLGEATSKTSVLEATDSQESSKRLAPTLEPVKERKSEYGLDGYDPALAEKASGETKAEDRQGHQYVVAQLNPKDDSRDLSSPKLPNLNRISEFGIDLFSKPKPDEASVLGSTSNPPRFSETINQSSETEPSIGFKSVVQQAFDTSREIPVSETPISPSGSEVKRTDSESTCTAGISPIMSRVPSLSIAENLARQGGRRGTPTPAITELDEPDSRRASAHMPTDPLSRKSTPKLLNNERLPLQHGHRDTAPTPSPGNSPARTPNLETNGKFPAGEIAFISEISDTPVSPLDKDIPQPPRPGVGREQNFRPGLGSYNTAANESPIDPEYTGMTRSDSPILPVSPISEGDEGKNNTELTPTAASQSLTQPAINSVPTSSAIAAAESGSIRSSTAFQPPSIVPDRSTPDFTLAPPSKSHVQAEVDSRLLSNNELEQSREKQSQPPSVGISESALTFLNDSSSEELSIHRFDSIPPTAPLRQRTPEEMAAGKDLPHLIHPQTLSNLSTNTSPHDEESDRLRKEIVKSLSPKFADAESRQFLFPSNSLEPGRREENVTSGGRESTYLPSEYDNYWASADDPEAGEQGRPKSTDHPRSAKAQEATVSPVEPSLVALEVVGDMPVATPLDAKTADNNANDMQPSKFPNRFSWEAGPEQVSAKGTYTNTKLEQQTPVPASFAATPDTQLRHLEESREAYLEHSTSTTSPLATPLPVGSLPPSKMTMVLPARERQAKPSTEQRSNEEHTRIDTSPTGGTVAAEPTVSHTDDLSKGQAPSGAAASTTEKSSAIVSPYGISPSPPEGEHPARTPPPNLKASLPSTPASVLATQPPDFGKIMQFKDILALPHPSQRIKTFNETRYQFVTMDTGLSSWLEILDSQQESTPSGNWGVNANIGNSTARSRVQKSSGTSSPALQQPYYQQYLNASPTTTAPLGPRPGTAGITSGSQQGFSLGNSKSSSQSKGKDLLHSAGILGGKASKAGKGLLSKGKNRFRGSGSGDKVD
jgi:hypothetical protein